MPLIVLTGFMGTGKSTVGRRLAERLGIDFVDTDEMIEAVHGPIPAIFEHEGEAAFRRYEREVADQLGCRSDASMVVATGGRFMLDPHNVEALQPARVFCLTAEVETIVARVTAGVNVGGRPLLAADDVVERVTALLAERADAYGRFEQVPTDHRSPGAVAGDLLARLGES